VIDALALGLRLAHALEACKVPYALGGALAFGAAGLPRGTLDVDVNVFVELDQLDPVFDALRAIGADFDSARMLEDAHREGMFSVRVEGMRVDVFVPSIPFSWEAERTRRKLRYAEADAWYLSPEALAVFKLLFFRSKDIADLERLIASQGMRLDLAYVRRHIAEMMGEDDDRVATWDRLVREFAVSDE
jgi:hypothetical protein